MLGPDFFARCGLFVDEHFFDAATCEAMISEMRAGGHSPATVRTTGSHYEVIADIRSAKWSNVSERMAALTEARLVAVKPAVERHFNVTLRDLQPVQFLVYQQGDFYGAHRDDSREETADRISKARRISVVIFLNSSVSDARDGCYGGGFLTMYGLFGDERAKNTGFPLAGKAGTLVAFPADTPHEVTAVQWGERYTIVTWFA